MKANETLIELLDELQVLDRIPRTGYLTRGVADPESVAEHSFHVAMLVWALGPTVTGLDMGRALGLALIHDLGETRLGDIPLGAAAYLPPGAKRDGERAAALELLAPLGERAGEALAEALAGESLEARFVKACDRLQLQVKAAHYERRGATAAGELRREAETDDGGFPAVREALDALSRRSAR